MNNVISKISQHYQLNQEETKECLLQTADILKLNLKNILKLFERVFQLKLIQKYNLNTLSFDLIFEFVFPRLKLKEILSVCSINKKFHQKCINNDLYWRKYLKQHYSITHKPKKYKNWFNLVQAISSAPNFIFKANIKLDTNKSNLKKLGQYLIYTSKFRIDLNNELEIKYKSKYYQIETEQIRFCSVLYERFTPELIIAANINSELVIYSLDDELRTIKENLYDFSNAGKVIQIQNYNNKGCLVLTQNSLFEINTTGIKEIKIPVQFQYMNLLIFYNIYPIVFIDLKGKIWIRGSFRHKSEQKYKFTQLGTPFKAKEAILSYITGIKALNVLDEEGNLWVITEMHDTPFRKIKEIGNPKTKEMRNNIKFKSISYWSTNFIIVLTVNNEIWLLNTTSNYQLYLDTGLKIPEGYISAHFQNIGEYFKDYGTIITKKLF